MLEKNAYVYMHKRPDKNQVFYIGIGTSANFKRAYQRIKRNSRWKNIVKKVGLEVNVIFENITLKEAISWEIYLISLYGREQLNKGTLCNMTDGGDGTVGRIMSEEEKNNVRKRITKEFYEAGVKFAAQVNKIPVVQLTKTGEFIKTWNSASDAAKTLFDGNGISLIRNCCKGVRKSAKGFAWKNYKDYIYECN